MDSVFLFEKRIGDIFKIGEYEFVVLEHNKITRTTSAILKNLLHDNVKFGDNCDYKVSEILPILAEFSQKVENIVGCTNLISHTVSLTANDGLKNYGEIEAKASLLTADLYRKYVEILEDFNPNQWWWLATPYSTPRHGFSQLVMCVTPQGDVGNYVCGNERGVRPFCIFKSNIFVS